MASKVIVFVSGTLSWAKILGDPVPNYSKDGREWTFELEPDEKGLQALLKNGAEDKIKGKGYNIGTKGQHAERAPFIQLKKTEFMKDGTPNAPIRIYNDNDEEWNHETLIGNGSKADVKIDIRDYGVGKRRGVYPAAIRITDLVEYQSSEFGAMDEVEDRPKKVKPVKKDTFAEDFGLDDEIPV